MHFHVAVAVLLISSRFLMVTAVVYEKPNCFPKMQITEPYKLNISQDCKTAATSGTVVTKDCLVPANQLSGLFKAEVRKCDCCEFEKLEDCVKDIQECLQFEQALKPISDGLCKCVECEEMKANQRGWKAISCPSSTSGGGGSANGGGNNGEHQEASGAGLKAAHVSYQGFLLILLAPILLI